MAKCACRDGNPCAYHEALGECWPDGEPTICERIGTMALSDTDESLKFVKDLCEKATKEYCNCVTAADGFALLARIDDMDSQLTVARAACGEAAEELAQQDRIGESVSWELIRRLRDIAAGKEAT